MKIDSLVRCGFLRIFEIYEHDGNRWTLDLDRTPPTEWRWQAEENGELMFISQLGNERPNDLRFGGPRWSKMSKVLRLRWLRGPKVKRVEIWPPKTVEMIEKPSRPPTPHPSPIFLRQRPLFEHASWNSQTCSDAWISQTCSDARSFIAIGRLTDSATADERANNSIPPWGAATMDWLPMSRADFLCVAWLLNDSAHSQWATQPPSATNLQQQRKGETEKGCEIWGVPCIISFLAMTKRNSPTHCGWCTKELCLLAARRPYRPTNLKQQQRGGNRRNWLGVWKLRKRL